MELVERLKKDLEALRKLHRSMYADYGSELCVGELIKTERLLEEKIKQAELDKQQESNRTSPPIS